MAMVTRKKSDLEKIYPRDSETKSFIIQAAVNQYNDIFNELDPAPFKKRDINQELKDYLEDCSLDIPLRYNVILQFSIPKSARDHEKEKSIESGLKTYFSFLMKSLEKNLKRSYQKNFIYIITAFVLLLTASFTGTFIGTKDVILFTLVQGLYIGGWVFLWEAISSFSFYNRDIKYEYRQYKRFYNAPIYFKNMHHKKDSV